MISEICCNFKILIYKQLQTKIAMITENKVTEIFCMADDFCKFFDTMVAKYTLKPIGKYYCPLNFWVRYKFRADTSHEVSALFVIFAFVSQLR